ncbi:primosomal protein N' (replication factor Y) - superfamily II helicase [Tabrizicola oligotrophica]|uniref:primosomal protein N' (replication factor Y) - superfamily II helicase n=1 Tax=Tabrizicola oligotrophica TaxID=2710650 RepID=UPI001D130443|nr:primosomal protein N' (replication factor Y) - superfamily II helicase [Tabrizicola oligotrophica]
MAVAEAHRTPCAQCGADLRFAPGQTQLVCDHCGHVQDIPGAAPRRKARALGEIPLARGLANDLPDGDTEEVRSTTCPNCGAVVEFQGASHAAECPFCATPVVVDTGTRRRIKPQALVPFALTEPQAHDALTKWLGGLWFAPNGLLDYTRKGRAMAGIYVPFWTFDAATASQYTGQRGEAYYETRTVTVNVKGRAEQRQEQVRKIRWYPAAGRVSRDFDDVMVMASTSLPERLGNDLTPWDLARLEAYAPEFLSGFQAEGYTVALADGHQTARAQMARVIESDVRRDIGGDEQRIHTLTTRHADETFRHVLLPVWTAAYKYNGKSYRFLVNGQTGEVQGERPYSWWKIGFAVLAVAAVVAVAVYLNGGTEIGGTIPLPDWLN